MNRKIWTLLAEAATVAMAIVAMVLFLALGAMR